jgi:hypothetical protein
MLTITARTITTSGGIENRPLPKAMFYSLEITVLKNSSNTDITLHVIPHFLRS